MRATARRFCQLAALLLALATLIGALGAHALQGRLSADRYDVLQTALHYQFFHALGLLGLGLLLDRLPLRTLRVAGWLLFAGVLLFCGSLYLLLAGAPRMLGVLTPLGGLALIAAWCLAAIAVGGRAAASDQRQQ
ncbi:MAG TPA: DUF423 domain-containing protein [Steroidobacteraceae bacterium]|jgi:uncharacterized membrane protein YgdD (TMEM256/DUF423 family)|nr:DUF423 domain-containing protein [Steroidobacteraceae bacterium]